MQKVQLKFWPNPTEVNSKTPITFSGARIYGVL